MEKDSGRVLIIDDNAEMLGIFREGLPVLFGDRHVEFAFAEDAYRALDLFAGKPFEVALVDLRMPGMDGLELLETLKQSSPECEVIVHTAYADVDVAVRCLNKGAYALLRKPCPLAEVCSVVGHALDKVAFRRKEKRWESELGKFSSRTILEIIDNATELIFVFSNRLRMVACNAAARSLMPGGQDPKKDADQQPLLPPELAVALEESLAGVAQPGPVTVTTAQGQVTLAVSITQILDDAGKLDQVLLRARDGAAPA